MYQYLKIRCKHGILKGQSHAKVGKLWVWGVSRGYTVTKSKKLTSFGIWPLYAYSFASRLKEYTFKMTQIYFARAEARDVPKGESL
jgi:hypothetical protein